MSNKAITGVSMLLAWAFVSAWIVWLSEGPVDPKGWAGAPTPWPTPAGIVFDQAETTVSNTIPLALTWPGDAIANEFLEIYTDKLDPYHVREACARSLLGVFTNQNNEHGDVRRLWIRRAKRDCPKDVAR